MKQLMKMTSLFALAGLTLMGCQTAGTVLEEGATPFTRGELYTYLSENTQITGEGGVYYSQEGTLETIVDGERVDGRWSTHDGGTLCRHLDSSDEESCESYYHNGEVVSTESDGKVSLAPSLMEGNTVVVKEMFTSEQIVELVSGKTVIWGSSGGAYYEPGGKLYTLEDGVRDTGTWSSDDGSLCWHIASWGNWPCEAYYMGADGLRVIYTGKDTLADEFQEGNTLDL